MYSTIVYAVRKESSDFSNARFFWINCEFFYFCYSTFFLLIVCEVERRVEIRSLTKKSVETTAINI